MEATKELVKLGIGVSILAPWIAQKKSKKSLVRCRSTEKCSGAGDFALARTAIKSCRGNFIGLCESAQFVAQPIGKTGH